LKLRFRRGFLAEERRGGTAGEHDRRHRVLLLMTARALTLATGRGPY
jgi:hypothetical protein